MELVYVTHPSFARHDTGMWHPERPARLEAVERGVNLSGVPVRRLEAPPVDRPTLERVHDRSYIAAIERFCGRGGGALDADTIASADSWEAAIHAAGAGPLAVDVLTSSPAETTALLAVRPPGHHALVSQAMGFCLFNNIVVTARMLADAGERVAIVDWDVHHGNGTQDMVGSDPEILYVSIHQYPFYPLTGSVGERGTGPGEGTVINAPIPAGTGGDVYGDLFERVVVPVLRQFDPDWVLISSGFDAHEEDPLAEVRLLSVDYRMMASRIREVIAPNRVIVFLEGGYHLAAIAASVSHAITGLSGLRAEYEPRRSPPAAWEVVERVVEETKRSWDVE